MKCLNYCVLLALSLLSSCSESEYISVPDINFEKAIIGLGYDDIIDGRVLKKNIASVEKLNVDFTGMTGQAFLQISDLTGLEGFISLTHLSCYNNLLTNLDLSQNRSLTNLTCPSNKLTSLDLSQNIALLTLMCYDNELAKLDISQNTALTNLNCVNNKLAKLDITQNKVLESLVCSHNKLTSLDVTQNTDLTSLNCVNNEVAYLDVTENTALVSLECNDNKLNSLDVSQNTALAILNYNLSIVGYSELTSGKVFNTNVEQKNDCVIYNSLGIPYVIEEAVLDLGGENEYRIELKGWKNGKIQKWGIIRYSGINASVGFYDKDDVPDIIVKTGNGDKSLGFLSLLDNNSHLLNEDIPLIINNSSPYNIDFQSENREDPDTWNNNQNNPYKIFSAENYFVSVPKINWLSFTEKYNINESNLSGKDYLLLAEKASMGEKFDKTSPFLVFALMLKGLEEVNKNPEDWEKYNMSFDSHYRNFDENYLSAVINEYYGYWKQDLLVPFTLHNCGEGNNLHMLCYRGSQSDKRRSIYNQKLEKIKGQLDSGLNVLLNDVLKKKSAFSISEDSHLWTLYKESIQRNAFVDLISQTINDNIFLEINIGFEKSDSLLNAYYKQLMSKADSNGNISWGDETNSTNRSSKTIRQKQRNWIKYKEACAKFFSQLNSKYSKEFWLNYFTIIQAEKLHDLAGCNCWSNYYSYSNKALNDSKYYKLHFSVLDDYNCNAYLFNGEMDEGC